MCVLRIDFVILYCLEIFLVVVIMYWIDDDDDREMECIMDLEGSFILENVRVVNVMELGNKCIVIGC